ncbi:MAG: Crp/Fnr family transcriptional regulator [Chloroflexi bacterium]|nr:Crp/Fnr family transcriptional regulator [Chloroflexota bacterium]
MHAQLSPEVLGTFALFEGLTPTQLTWLHSRLHYRSLRAGTYVISREMPAEAIYLILEGTVKVAIPQSDGGETILEIVGPGKVVGEMGLVDNNERSADVLTLEKSALLILDRPTFDQCVNTIPPFVLNLLRVLNARLRRANEQIQALMTLDVSGRVARQLLAYADEYGEPVGDGTLIPIRLTQTDIAQLVGASRERVNQIVRRLRRKGLIGTGPGRRIILHDRNALAEQARLHVSQ